MKTCGWLYCWPLMQCLYISEESSMIEDLKDYHFKIQDRYKYRYRYAVLWAEMWKICWMSSRCAWNEQKNHSRTVLIRESKGKSTEDSWSLEHIHLALFKNCLHISHFTSVSLESIIQYVANKRHNASFKGLVKPKCGLHASERNISYWFLLIYLSMLFI